jgi:hypothetical protein
MLERFVTWTRDFNEEHPWISCVLIASCMFALIMGGNSWIAQS